MEDIILMWYIDAAEIDVIEGEREDQTEGDHIIYPPNETLQRVKGRRINNY